MGENHIRNPEAVRDALRQVCARGELVILVTPYVRFESVFLRLALTTSSRWRPP